MKMTLLGLAVIALGLVGSDQASAQGYAEGQVWEYKTRPGETGSALKIVKVDRDPKLGNIFHISIVGVRIKGPQGVLTELPHVPVAKETLDKSVTKLSKANISFPDFRRGYAEWIRVKGGVFNVTVAEIVSLAEKAFSGAKREP